MRITSRKRIALPIYIAGVLSLFFTMQVPATTLARLSLDQLVAAADAIARVRCVAVQEGWENGAIWTITSFAPVRTFKGSLPEQFSVRLPGGRAGHLTSIVEGAPKFAAGEEAIVFLEKSSAGGFTVSGWVQGTFRITRDQHSSGESVTQESSAFALFDPRTRTFQTEGVRQMPIEQFRERIAAAIARDQEKIK